MDKIALGRKLRVRRNDLGLVQKALADPLGLTHTAVHLWEKGKAAVPSKYHDQLAKLLNVPLKFFYEEDYWPSEENALAKPSVSDAVTEFDDQLSPADLEWCRRMSATLKSVPLGDRERFRREIENRARAIKDFLIGYG